MIDSEVENWFEELPNQQLWSLFCLAFRLKYEVRNAPNEKMWDSLKIDEKHYTGVVISTSPPNTIDFKKDSKKAKKAWLAEQKCAIEYFQKNGVITQFIDAEVFIIAVVINKRLLNIFSVLSKECAKRIEEAPKEFSISENPFVVRLLGQKKPSDAPIIKPLPEDFYWDGKTFMFGASIGKVFRSRMRRSIFELLTETEGGLVKLRELVEVAREKSGRKDLTPSEVRTIISQIRMEIEKKTQGEVTIKPQSIYGTEGAYYLYFE